MDGPKPVGLQNQKTIWLRLVLLHEQTLSSRSSWLKAFQSNLVNIAIIHLEEQVLFLPELVHLLAFVLHKHASYASSSLQSG